MATTEVLNEQLYDAVERMDTKSATELLRRGADVNTRGGSLGYTVLMKACDSGCKSMVDLLMQNSADVNLAGGPVRLTPLIVGSWMGREEIVDLLLKKNPDLNHKNIWGRTALHYAVSFNHLPIVKRLISCGATVDIDDNQGVTPLWDAASKGNTSCVDVLLGAGADPHHKSKRKGSPIDAAKKIGEQNLVKTMKAAAEASKTGQQKKIQPFPTAAAVVPTNQAPPQTTPLARPSDFRTPKVQPDMTKPAIEMRQPPAASATTGRDEELLGQLIDQVEQLRQESETKERQIVEIRQQKQKELDDALQDKKAMETEMRGQNEALQQVLTEARREKDQVIQEKDKEKQALQHELHGEREEKNTLEELLTASEAAHALTRDRVKMC